MIRRHRRMAVILAIPGIAACLFAIVTFLRDFLYNRIPWRPLLSHRDVYMAMGGAFRQGFVAGFFLCFFLTMTALAVGTWFEQRKGQQRVADLAR